jgi:hypothetical protein
MRSFILGAAGALLTSIASAPVAANTGIVFAGTAKQIDTRQLLYRELHYLSDPGTTREVHLVHYQCPNSDAVFARKELFYGANRVAPRFTLTDPRIGFVEGVRNLGDGRTQVFHKHGPQRNEKTASLPRGKTLVIDAGFDEFVRRNWDALERGQAVKFSFLVPSRLQAIDFKLTKHHEETLDGVAASVFRLNLSGLLGWLLPYIEVSYRKSDRLLVRYKGLTNMRDLAGDNLAAEISLPAAERRIAKVDLAALRAVSLVSRCP